MIREELPKILRLKVVALVTVEVHARDVIDKLAKTGCSDVNAFEWLCQLRLYWEKDKDKVRQEKQAVQIRLLRRMMMTLEMTNSSNK